MPAVSRSLKKGCTAVINKCNDCHSGMGYGFIKVVTVTEPADRGIYTGKSQ